MENLVKVAKCSEDTCFFPSRCFVALLSIVSMVACVPDLISDKTYRDELRKQVKSMKEFLIALFQMANVLLLLASIVEAAFLVQIYVWYTLGFVVMGLVVAILQFVCRMRDEGVRSFIFFLPEIAFLFALFRCLPLVDTYRKYLDSENQIS